MLPNTAAELAGLAGARLLGEPTVEIGPDVVIDSRAVTPGSLFVALPGERVDGHDFAVAAVAAGAAGVLVSQELPVGVPQLIVTDTSAALARLAAAVVSDRIGAAMVSIGVTGSSGKTSTKDLIAQVLAAVGETVAPSGSANNEIGVPLTALRIGADTRFLVSELGARGQGHVRWLCDIVQPAVGVVVNVGQAHLGEFGSVAAIASAKAELVLALPAVGWAVLNADDALVAAMATQTSARLAGFAVGAEPAFGELRVWASDVSADDRQRPSFTLNAAGVTAGTARVRLQVSGVHQVGNAVAAAAVGITQGMSVPEVSAALSSAVARSRWRMELLDAPSGLLVVNDSYNANPDSMAAALRAVAGMRRDGGRLLAVLGDMLELGPDAAAAHRSVGELASQLGFDELFVLGEFACDFADGARSGGILVTASSDSAAAAVAVAAVAGSNDVVLVKASRGLALESVAQRLADGAVTESGR